MRGYARGPRGVLLARGQTGHTPPVPAASIITPPYHHAPFLAQCIESVLGQTFQSWEQIIIDDGSTDGTGDVAQRYRDPRVRYVRQRNLGLARLPETDNRALSLCRTSLIAILEGDDYWPPDKLEALVPAFEDPAVVLAYGVTEVVGEGRPGSRGRTSRAALRPEWRRTRRRAARRWPCWTMRR